MNAKSLLLIYAGLKIVQYFFETWLSVVNRRHYLDKKNQNQAQKKLQITESQMEEALAYSGAKYKFSRFSNLVKTFAFLSMLIFGGFAYLDDAARSLSFDSNILTGLAFFGSLLVLNVVFSLPFDYYFTFVLEEKFGFNRQSKKTFIVDRLKGLLIGWLLGGLLLSLILWIMQTFSDTWWLFAWIVVSLFSLLTAWIYPTFIAPMFNKFTPIPDGELLDKVNSLSEKIGFQHDGLSIMNASTRSSHGNAYFTGVFGKKKIVLFDTLVNDLSADEVVAVLAHELGHFKLNHVRDGLIRGVIFTGIIFYFLSLLMPYEVFYEAFHFSSATPYLALFVFSLWFGLVDFFINPFESYLSRRNEFAADEFAAKTLKSSHKLSSALLKLREKSQAMPVSHPWFSFFYYSHPPMLERIDALNKLSV